VDHPRLVILGYSEAAMFVRGSAGASVTAIISIHGVREFGVVHPVGHRLDLSFDDVEAVSDANDVMAMQRAMSRRRWAEQNGLVEVPPTRSDVQRIIEFAEDIRDVDGIVLCHCGAGMSRAPAAALICLAVWEGAGAERECVAQIGHLRRGAVPQIGLIAFADELLGRAGKFVDAVRGARIGAAQP
jgi:predicted protein tyrosine phosphatase